MNTKKIAFFIELNCMNESLNSVDISLGNPGIGGTQYLFLLTVKYLNHIYGNDFAIFLTDNIPNFADQELNFKHVPNVQKAIEFCELNNVSNLVLNANVLNNISENLLETKINLFLWAHNTLNWKCQCIASKKSNIKKVICVSEQQYKNMSDTPCFSKCTYINNVIPQSFYENAILTNYKEEKVIYIGGIVPQKGCHNLLDIWSYVEKKNKNAQLYIFGSESTWNKRAKLGKMGIANKYYEKILSKKIKKLKYPDNVHFLGNKSWKEISNMIDSSRLAIVNPSHYLRDETFCMSAIEIESYAIPVISRYRNDGLNTTIKNGSTGFLEKTDKKIAKKIILLLNDEELAKKMGKQAREYAKTFLINQEIPKWIKLICDKNEISNLKINRIIKSKDALYLEYDYLLKIVFYIKSGKIWDFLKNKFIALIIRIQKVIRRQS